MTNIEWTHRPGTTGVSWNTIGGCTKMSPECDRCYALRDSWRIQHNPKRPGRYTEVATKEDGTLRWTGRINLDWEEIERPWHWTSPRTVFVCSMADLFHEDVPDEFIAEMFRTMIMCDSHTYLVLTKRAERMRRWFADRLMVARKGTLLYLGTLFLWPRRHIWPGVTAGTQDGAVARVPHLLEIPAWHRWASYEPALEFVDFTPWLGRSTLSWIVAGGESGSNCRHVDVAWLRHVRDDCAGRASFFMKRMSGSTHRKRSAIPDDLLIREWPA